MLSKIIATNQDPVETGQDTPLNKPDHKESLALIKKVGKVLAAPFILLPFDDIILLAFVSFIMVPLTPLAMLPWGAYYLTRQALKATKIIPASAKELKRIWNNEQRNMTTGQKAFFQTVLYYREQHVFHWMKLSKLRELKQNYITAFNSKDLDGLTKFCEEVDSLPFYEVIQSMNLAYTREGYARSEVGDINVSYPIDGFIIDITLNNGLHTEIILSKDYLEIHKPPCLADEQEVSMALELIACQIFIRKVCLPVYFLDVQAEST